MRTRESIGIVAARDHANGSRVSVSSCLVRLFVCRLCKDHINQSNVSKATPEHKLYAKPERLKVRRPVLPRRNSTLKGSKHCERHFTARSWQPLQLSAVSPSPTSRTHRTPGEVLNASILGTTAPIWATQRRTGQTESRPPRSALYR